MKYSDCEIGMRVSIPDEKRTGTITALHPVLNMVDKIVNRPPDLKLPGVVFNMVSVKYDEPLEQTPMGPVRGVTLDPKEIEPLTRH